jgi:thymidylate synthase (FAD)
MTSDRIDVLDSGYIRLVDSMPKEPGAGDLSIVRAARVSYDAAWRAGEDAGSDARLIHYLWRHKHSTPFESVEFQFEVMLPIFVARQWMRHRTWTYNELSGRYRELPELFYVPRPEHIGTQSEDNKQGRVFCEHGYVEACAVGIMRDAFEEAFKTYHELLEHGVPRELARTVLPLSTYTHFFAKVDLRNLFGFLDLRNDQHAQYEIRQYAEAMLDLVRPIAPVAVAAWEDGRKGNG